MLAPPALLYIWRPTHHPRPGVGRPALPARGVPRGDPAHVRGAVRARRSPDRRLARLAGQRRSLAVVLAVATVVFPWLTIRDVSQMTEQRGLFPVITTACKILGHDGAVVVLQERDVDRVAERPADACARSATFRSRSWSSRPNAGLLHTLAAQWRAAGPPAVRGRRRRRARSSACSRSADLQPDRPPHEPRTSSSRRSRASPTSTSPSSSS